MSQNNRGMISVAAGILVLTWLAIGSAVAQVPEKIYADIDEEPGGQAYGRWAVEWWQWALGVPGATNPILDTTGANCGERQIDDVWFLAGTFGSDPVVRECTVPEGASLFFPLINRGFFVFDEDPPPTEAELRGAVACVNPVDLFFEVDGDEIDEDDLQNLFTGASGSESPLFNVQLPLGNLTGLGEDVIPELLFSPSVEQGYYLFLKPLSPGQHTLRWVATGCSDPPGSQDITYFLSVGDGGSASSDATPEPAATGRTTHRVQIPGNLRR